MVAPNANDVVSVTDCRTVLQDLRVEMPMERIFIITYLVVISLFSLFTNLLLVVVLIKSKQTRFGSNRLLLAISITYCINALIFHPMFAVALTTNIIGSHGNNNCALVTTIDATGFFLAHLLEYFIIVIVIDRLIHAVTSKPRSLRPRSANLIISFGVLLAGVFTAVFMITYHNSTFSLSTISIYGVVILCDLIIFVITVACYVVMCLRLKRHTANSMVYQATGDSLRRTMPPYERRFFYTVFLVLVFTVITHLPYLVGALYYASEISNEDPPTEPPHAHLLLLLAYSLLQANGGFSAIIILYRNTATNDVVKDIVLGCLTTSQPRSTSSPSYVISRDTTRTAM